MFNFLKISKKKKPAKKTKRRKPMRRLSNYDKSNSILDIDIVPSNKAKILVKKMLKSKSTILRQKISQALLDELSVLMEIDVVRVKISDAKQYHKKSKGRVVYKQYGYYKPSTKYIYINNKTAVRQQILAPKTFVDTLLHEWMHHYDHEALKLDSIHTTGFYQRVRNLKIKLGVPIKTK
jgi:hypothetical protein